MYLSDAPVQVRREDSLAAQVTTNLTVSMCPTQSSSHLLAHLGVASDGDFYQDLVEHIFICNE